MDERSQSANFEMNLNKYGLTNILFPFICVMTCLVFVQCSFGSNKKNVLLSKVRCKSTKTK